LLRRKSTQIIKGKNLLSNQHRELFRKNPL
jgi:hypothetical protein